MKFAFSSDLVRCATIFSFFYSSGECLSSVEAVRRFFRYFTVDEPVGLPVLEPPEPMSLPPYLELIPVGIHDGKLYGHSKAFFKYVEINFEALTGTFTCHVPHLVLLGNYSWHGFFGISKGQIWSELSDVELKANFSMEINSQDVLQIVDFDSEVIAEDMNLNMTNLLWDHQIILDSGSINVFFFGIVDEITRQLKPLVIDSFNSYMEEILSSIPEADDSLWRARSLDRVPARGSSKAEHTAFFLRRILQYFGADPLKIPDIKFKELGLRFMFSEIELEGLSFIGRIKSLWVVYENKEIYVFSSMLYPHLLVKSKLTIRAMLMRAKNDFNLDMEDAKINILLVIDPSQKQPPRIENFDLKIGGFRNLKKGRNSNIFDKIFASSAKSAFNFFVSEMKGSIKMAIQDRLDRIHLEDAAINFLQQ